MPHDLVGFFLTAAKFVQRAGFSSEVLWSEERPHPKALTSQHFLQDHAWVVLCSGMKVQVIANKWRSFYKTFYNFRPEVYTKHGFQPAVRQKALSLFNNPRKIDAILQMGEVLQTEGWETIHQKILEDSPEFNYLDSLPFIGKITKFHLARNLGFDVIKPDRHLVRLGEYFCMDPIELCDLIYEGIQHKFRLGTIDLILWRYCEQGQFPSSNKTLEAFL